MRVGNFCVGLLDEVVVPYFEDVFKIGYTVDRIRVDLGRELKFDISREVPQKLDSDTHILKSYREVASFDDSSLHLYVGQSYFLVVGGIEEFAFGFALAAVGVHQLVVIEAVDWADARQFFFLFLG